MHWSITHTWEALKLVIVYILKAGWRHGIILNLPIYLLPRRLRGVTRGQLGKQRQVSVSDKTDDIWAQGCEMGAHQVLCWKLINFEV